MAEQQTPPWGSDEEFNPEKAWNLIQNLRSENKTLKDSQTTAQAESERALAELRQQNEELQATVQLTADSVAEKESLVAQRDATLAKHNLLSEAGLPLKYVGNVTGDSEEDWQKSVAGLAELRGAGGQVRRPDPAQAADTQNNPQADRESIARDFLGLE